MNETMFNEFTDILNTVQGDIIDFRVYKGSTFGYLVSLGEQYNREVFGMDTFQGLPKPDPLFDKNKQGYISYPAGYAKTTLDVTQRGIKNISGNAKYNLYSGSLEDTLKQIPKDKKFAIAYVDLFQYHSTNLAVNFLKDKMADGGLIYFNNYYSQNNMADKAINDFLEKLEIPFTVLPNSKNAIIPHKRIVWNPPKISITKINSTNETTTPTNSVNVNITVALVLRSGGDTYNYRYVNALANNIRQQSTVPIKIVCLTDIPDGIDTNIVNEIIPLKHKFKGWWSKIELFRPDIFTTESVVYFDLDTVILSRIDDILLSKLEFAGIRDLYHWDIFQTGILVWNPNKNHQIYTNFIKNPEKCIQEHVIGDASYIRANVNKVEFLQDRFPAKIVSYKANCINKFTRSNRDS